MFPGWPLSSVICRLWIRFELETQFAVGGGAGPRIALARKASFRLVGGGGLGLARKASLRLVGGGGLGLARKASLRRVGSGGGGQRLTFRKTFPVSFVTSFLTSARRRRTEA